MRPRSCSWGALPLLAACDPGPVLLEDAHDFTCTGIGNTLGLSVIADLFLAALEAE